MTLPKKSAAAFAAMLLVSTIPGASAQAISAAASASGVPTAIEPVVNKSAAERLKKLDIMLMVSSLRCRHGAHNFRAAYQAFNAKHRLKLNAAHGALKASLVAKFGAVYGKKALDRIDVSMANQYGQGHPWLNCQELADMAQQLTRIGTKSELLSAADYLLGSAPATKRRTVLVARY